MKAIRIHVPGDRQQLVYEDISKPSPKMGQALIQVHAVGITPRSLSDWELKSSIISDRFFHEPSAMHRFGPAERETGRNSNPKRLANRPDSVVFARPEPILSRRRAF